MLPDYINFINVDDTNNSYINKILNMAWYW
jgi:hypothetical protein